MWGWYLTKKSSFHSHGTDDEKSEPEGAALTTREGPSALSTPGLVVSRGQGLLQGSRRATGAPRRADFSWPLRRLVRVASGRSPPSESGGRPKSPMTAPAGAKPCARQSPRRGASVTRRDPRKGAFPLHDTRLGVERVEDPSQGFQRGSAPLAGCQGSALTGVQGQRPWASPVT